MGNTLFLYDATDAARQTVQIMASIASMSKYMTYTAEAIPVGKYSRIICVLTAQTDHAAAAAILQQHTARQKIGIVGVNLAEAAWQTICRHLEQQLGDALVFTACVHDAADTEEIIRAGEQLRALDSVPTAQDAQVLAAIEAFLQQHNTCALATGHDNLVRATPIEYIYDNQTLYIFSEGGQKFANLYRNPQVSLTVFDAYEGLETLAGLQIDGRCRMIEPDEPKYRTIAAAKGLTQERLAAMPVMLHIVEIEPVSAVFLWAGFLKIGKAIRQSYRF